MARDLGSAIASQCVRQSQGRQTLLRTASLRLWAISSVTYCGLKTDCDSHLNLGFGFGSVFTENRGFGFGFKTDPALKNMPSAHHRTVLSDYIFTIKACIDNRKKKLVKQQCLLHMFSQYGELRPLAAEICWRVCGTPANFNGFCILAALLHGTLVVGVSQTL